MKPHYLIAPLLMMPLLAAPVSAETTAQPQATEKPVPSAGSTSTQSGNAAGSMSGTAASSMGGMQEGMIMTMESNNSVEDTMDRLEDAVEDKDMKVFARINYAEGAEDADMKLPPTQLLLFGNPKMGTSLVKCDPTVGLELPQKVMAWEDSAGKIWLAYKDQSKVSQNYKMDSCKDAIQTAGVTMDELAKKAATKE